jgi:ubiquinone/menaquinone biosynthesis C-methylase UbiE
LYEQQILPRVINVAMRQKMVTKERKKALDGVGGVVLEVGFGSGLNLPLYTRKVERVVAIDPSAVAHKLARKRIEGSPFPVEYMALSGEQIPAAEGSFDTVVTTFTLCTIPDASRALSEMRRVLKRGGKLYFLEHGASSDSSVRGWQRRLNGIQGALFGGCQLDREIDRLILGAGFEMERLESYYGTGPKPLVFLYRGVALKA